MALIGRFKKQTPPQWDAYNDLWGGWNYPKPLYHDEYDNCPPDDRDLTRLIYMAEYGWYYCQQAYVSMLDIYPFSGYKPKISQEFRQTFKQRLIKENIEGPYDPMPLTIYEKDGKFILSTTWEEYWLYREEQKITALCTIVGHFTERQDIAICDRPFMVTKKDDVFTKLRRSY